MLRSGVRIPYAPPTSVWANTRAYYVRNWRGIRTGIQSLKGETPVLRVSFLISKFDIYYQKRENKRNIW